MGLEQFTPAQLYEFWRFGDANLDGKIDDKDLDLITDFLGSYHPATDLNEDGKVDTVDLQIAAQNYGLNIYSYYGVINHDAVKTFLIGAAIFLAGAGIVYWRLKRR